MPGKLRGSQLALEISCRYTEGKRNRIEGKNGEENEKKRREKRLGEAVM